MKPIYQKNDLFEVQIEDMNNLGYGVARIEGFVVFVAGGVTGDRAKVRLIKVAHDYAVARMEALISPSEHRVTPPCDAFAHCGGCSFLHITDAYEKTLKESFVKSALKKEGLDTLSVLPLIGAKERFFTRNKAQYPLYRDKDGRVQPGFFAAHSHTPVNAADCMLVPKTFSQVAKHLCAAFTAHGFSCYDEERATGLLRHLVLRGSTAEDKILAGVVINGTALPDAKRIAQDALQSCDALCGVLVNYNQKRGNVILGDKTELIAGERVLTETLCGKHFRFGLTSFFQTNRDAAALLFDTARGLLNLSGEERVCDLYCGVGAAGICIAPDNPLWGAETQTDAVAFAEENARQNGVSAVYVPMDAAVYYETAGRFDVVIADPPRSGMSDALLCLLCAKPPQKLLYISCNPMTFARDLRTLFASGYTAGDIRPIDMFPKTGHVECVCALKAPAARESAAQSAASGDSVAVAE